MTKKVIRRLGERLNHIFQWVDSSPTYDDIWDLCCDHGRLGLHLHERHSSSCVYLVDKVASIMDTLAVNYAEFNDGRLYFKAMDVCELNITVEKRTLVIIAGVGGQNIMVMLESILAQLHIGERLEFMLSPNSHLFELRRFLKEKSFGLINEAFITEKSFSHEHLWLSFVKHSTANEVYSEYEPVSAVGDSLWHNMTDIKRVYIGKLIQHYQRMLDNNPSRLSDAALKAYGRLL